MSLHAIPRPCLSGAASASLSSSAVEISLNRLSDYSDSGTSSDGTDWSSSYRHGPSRQSSTTSLSSLSSCTSSYRRPLPRLPSNTSLSNPRPLPVVPRGPRSDSTPHRCTPFRPLPSPITSASADSLLSPPMRTDSLHALPNKRKALAPKVNLILDFKSSNSAMELVLESPIHPLTPIRFDVDECDDQRRNQEDELAVRLTAFGFVEVSEGTDRPQRRDEDVVFIVEESRGRASYAKRCSRKWVREKRGKRWIEDDYKRVLESLRKL